MLVPLIFTTVWRFKSPNSSLTQNSGEKGFVGLLLAAMRARDEFLEKGVLSVILSILCVLGDVC